MDHVSAETDVSRIMFNLEAQHKYLTWRAEKVGEAVQLEFLVGNRKSPKTSNSLC